VWVGNTTGEGRPELTGINAAAPIMFDIFRTLPSTRWFEPPAIDVSYIDVCVQTGFKSGTECERTSKMLVSPLANNNAPLCPYHKRIQLDRTATYRVTANCESPAAMKHISWMVLPPTIEYYYKQRHTDYKPLPDFLPGCFSGTERIIDVIYPEENSKIYVPLEATGERGKTIFTATHRKTRSKLFWHVDNDFAGTTENFHQLALNPSPGKHQLTIVDESGESVTRHFEIIRKEKR
jgi:penicillin-binding protein 1C